MNLKVSDGINKLTIKSLDFLERNHKVLKVILVASIALLALTLAFNPFGYAAMAFLATAVLDLSLIALVELHKFVKKIAKFQFV